MKYRAEIDGLRAIAVLAVLAFHLVPAACPGGFVGVDVFFVISGYLISAIIQRDIEDEKFSILAFYERRVRRILPALLVTLALTSVVAYFCFLPDELRGYSKQLISALFSAANLFFWLTFGYFDFRPDSVPLLHTWSLAVEEQFYIFLPLFLFAVHRYAPRRLRTAIFVVAASSFIASVISIFLYPSATFYLPHTRAWELLIGAMVSLGLTPLPSTDLQREVAAVVGVCMIALALILFSATTLFPGPTALLPCVGTALVLASGQTGRSMTGRALSWRPLVFVGAISYSLYLWHWPVIILSKALLIVPPGAPALLVNGAMFGLSFGLAVLSWKFVEQPFRNPRRVPRRMLMTCVGAMAAMLAGVGAMMYPGLPGRFPDEARQVAAYIDMGGADVRDGKCFISSNYAYTDFKPSVCLPWASSGPNYLLIGDSHAAQYWPGLSRVLGPAPVMQATASGCKPIRDGDGESRCTRLMDYVFNEFLRDHKPDVMFIAARWFQSDLDGLEKTLQWTERQGIPTVLIGPIVEYDQAFPRLLAIAMRRKQPDLVDAHRVQAIAGVDANMDALARQAHVRFVSVYRIICPSDQGTCIHTPIPSVPLQFDYGHLTTEGSVFVVQRILSQLRPLTSPEGSQPRSTF